MDELTFVFGAEVHCLDDNFGKLSKLVIEPENLQIVELIAENGLIVKRARVIPLDKVSSIADDGIFLTLTKDEMLGLQEYRETHMERPAENALSGSFTSPDGMTSAQLVPMVHETIREGVSPKMKILSGHTAVENDGTSLGKLHAVNVYTPDRKVSSLVVRHGLVFTEVETVPAHEIDSLAEDVVTLGVKEPVPNLLSKNS